MLPSIEDLHLDGFKSGDNHPDNRFIHKDVYQHHQSSLKHFSARMCSLSIHFLTVLIERTKNLESFRYQHDYDAHRTWDCKYNATLSPRRIVTALQSRASHNLKTLDLSLSMPNHMRYRRPPFGVIKPLQPFDALASVRITFDMLVEPRSWIMKNRKPIAKRFKLHRLIDVLSPATVSVVLCRGWLPWSDARKVFRGLAEHKERLLPKLRKVTTQDSGQLICERDRTEIVRVCRVAQIELVFVQWRD